MRVDVASAEWAARQITGGAEAYGATVERLSHGLAGVEPVGPEGELVSALNEFTSVGLQLHGRRHVPMSGHRAGG
ncbi:hypothetical protein GCM10010412_097410 [Nonomuraea recticatena]|uniref:Uncharacterized protein n=1 Tax=Nonomuraea recticatena TaxID=46178 RepID=A0ABN3TE19_9ACTN